MALHSTPSSTISTAHPFEYSRIAATQEISEGSGWDDDSDGWGKEFEEEHDSLHGGSGIVRGEEIEVGRKANGNISESAVERTRPEDHNLTATTTSREPIETKRELKAETLEKKNAQSEKMLTSSEIGEEGDGWEGSWGEDS